MHRLSPPEIVGKSKVKYIYGTVVTFTVPWDKDVEVAVTVAVPGVAVDCNVTVV